MQLTSVAKSLHCNTPSADNPLPIPPPLAQTAYSWKKKKKH
jgi:hypothetical protein